MLFGNWTISEEAITWTGDEAGRFVVPVAELTDVSYHTKGKYFYSWILRATEEDWLTQDDLYDLNFAIVYAIAKTGQDFNYDVFDATLEEQYEQFEEEDDEDWEG